jgi:hypothetical protein
VCVKSKPLHQPTSIDEKFNKVRIMNDNEWDNNKTYILTKNIKLVIDFCYIGNEMKEWYDRVGIN